MESVNMTNFGLLHWEYENPPKFKIYWFEKVDGNELRLFARRFFPLVCIICCIYLLFIWLGPKWMKNRQPYNLDKPLIAWNFFMSLFSLTVVARLVPELAHLLIQPNGWYNSICLTDGLHYSTTFWTFLYGLSKIAELTDTVFIVLRKKPLSVLHWFHHFSMVWSSCLVFIEGEVSTMRYFVVYNSFVHAIMYAYFGLKGLKMKIPKSVSMTITALQISQFVVGLYGRLTQIYYQQMGKFCFTTNFALAVTLVFGVTYLFMFTHLFYKSYLAKPKVKAS